MLQNAEHVTDILIYGATAAGVAAGIQAIRDGKSVVVLDPGTHIGGLTTGGLGQTDIGNKQAIGGIAREFYRHIRAHYQNPDNWKWQKPQEYADDGQTRTNPDEDTQWTFEPSAATAVLNDMIRAANLSIITRKRLRRDGSGVSMEGRRISAINLEDGSRYRAKIFIDATYEGDLLAEAGVDYHIGRESNSTYDETLNGSQLADFAPTLQGRQYNGTLTCSAEEALKRFTPVGLLSMNAHNHQLKPGISPYVEAGNPASGLLPGIELSPLQPEGTADSRIQAYNYRITLTDHPQNRSPIERPSNYDPLQYELLLRHLAAHSASETPSLWINSPMPNRKTDTNNGGGFSTDWIGHNYDWIEASYTERECLAQNLKDYTLGLLWTLSNNPHIRADIRNTVAQWGLPLDEYTSTANFSPQVYVREGRRMMGELVITQHHCERQTVEKDIIGMAAYGMDSHHVRRYITPNGDVRNEGNVQGHVTSPYGVSYRALLPKRGKADNLIVPVALSSSHIAFGSIRMEPVFMLLAQSASTAASIAIEMNIPLHDIPYETLRSRLLADKQIM